MVEVIKISKGGASPRRRTVFLSDGSDPISAPSALLRASGVAVGTVAESRSSLLGMLEEHARSCAMDRSLDALSRRELSTHLIRTKLLDDGYNLQVVLRTVARLIELGYVDDERYAQHVWRTELNSGKGPARVKSRLRIAGIDQEIIEAAYLYCVDDGQLPDTLEAATSLALRWYRHDNGAAGAQKVLRRLVSRGFSYDTALTAIRRVSEGSNLDGDLGEGLA